MTAVSPAEEHNCALSWAQGDYGVAAPPGVVHLPQESVIRLLVEGDAVASCAENRESWNPPEGAAV
jgi:hypothetical protein